MRTYENRADVVAYYHDKGNKKATYSTKYKGGASLKQIRSDMKSNNAVLDATHNLGSDKVKVYRKKYLTEGDVRANPHKE